MSFQGRKKVKKKSSEKKTIPNLISYSAKNFVFQNFKSNLHKIVYCFEVIQVVVHYINTNTKIKSGIPPINNFEIAKL